MRASPPHAGSDFYVGLGRGYHAIFDININNGDVTTHELIRTAPYVCLPHVRFVHANNCLDHFRGVSSGEGDTSRGGD